MVNDEQLFKKSSLPYLKKKNQTHTLPPARQAFQKLQAPSANDTTLPCHTASLSSIWRSPPFSQQARSLEFSLLRPPFLLLKLEHSKSPYCFTVPTKALRSSKPFQPTKALSKLVSFSQKSNIPAENSLNPVLSKINLRPRLSLLKWNSPLYQKLLLCESDDLILTSLTKLSQPPQRLPHRFRRWRHMFFHWCRW